MRDSQEYFRTVSLPIASYLKMVGYDLWGMEFQDDIPDQLMFVFRVNADDPDLLKVMDDWTSTSRGAELNKIVQCSRIMKMEVMEAKKRRDLRQFYPAKFQQDEAKS